MAHGRRAWLAGLLAAASTALLPGVTPLAAAAHGKPSTVSRLYVTNFDVDTVTVLNAATNAVVATVPVGDTPTDAAVDAGRARAYVVNREDDTVSVINTDTNAVVTTVPVGDGPFDVAVDSPRARAYVTNSASDTVSAINTATDDVIDTFPAGDGPVGVAVLNTGGKKRP
ncbi:YncE family protein [Streptomyces sp. HUAS TT3]|uniref:YncE family protein n=1 Tax=Streptomyces sp. HUAS TT3 TaxID=3447510 RepID=UPI003F65D8B9